MNEEDAQTAALQEYFDSNTPAGYGASFRAGWTAGRIYEVGSCDHGLSWQARAESAEARLKIATEALRDIGSQDYVNGGSGLAWRALEAIEATDDEIGEVLERQRQPENQPCGAADDGQSCQWTATGPVRCETHGRTVFP